MSIQGSGHYGVNKFKRINFIELIDMRQGFGICSDTQHSFFLNLTCNMGIKYKGQRHATLAFLTVDMGNPYQGPHYTEGCKQLVA